MVDKFQFKGKVTYQKIIKAEEPILVLFKLELLNFNQAKHTSNSIPSRSSRRAQKYNYLNDNSYIQEDQSNQGDSSKELTALIARKPLTFLFEVTIGDIIIIYGHFNHKKQFITEKYLLQHKQDSSTAPSHLVYPYQKPEMKPYKNRKELKD